MSQTHKCKYMGNDQYPGEKPPNYLYKWDGEDGGWCLYANDQKLDQPGYTWVCNCNWCSEPLPGIDTVPKLDPMRGHRCDAIIRYEWAHNQGMGEDKSKFQCLAIIWDGFTWNTMNGDEVIGKRTPSCPYCRAVMPNPKEFRNKVVIS